MITQRISVPLDSNPPYERLKMHYGDSGRIVELDITYNGLSFVPPTGAVATFQAKKPDGTVVTRTDGVSIQGSTATIKITSNTLAQVGVVRCECLISSNGETVGTMRFEVEVTEPAVLPGDIESTDDYQSIVDAVVRAESAADIAEQSADVAQNINLHPVIIGENGNYWNWDSATNAYVDSGQAAQTGPKGDAATITVGSVTDGTAASIVNSGTPANAVFDFVLPRGKDGVSLIPKTPPTGEDAYREPGSTKPLPDLPDFATTIAGDSFLVDDDAIAGQYDIYYNDGEKTTWAIVQNWGGTPTPGTMMQNDYDANGHVKAAGGIFNAIYPVGSIYLSVNPANPSTLFGGTWEAWGAGRVPVGVAASGTFNTVEKTGGAETHTLAESQIPSHGHGFGTYLGWEPLTGTGATYTPQNWQGSLVSTAYTGGGQPHNNLQPYITCYMWKRTA